MPEVVSSRVFAVNPGRIAIYILMAPPARGDRNVAARIADLRATYPSAYAIEVFSFEEEGEYYRVILDVPIQKELF